MDVPEKRLKVKFQKEIETFGPIIKTLQRALFRSSTKAKALVFVRFDTCPCFVDAN